MSLITENLMITQKYKIRASQVIHQKFNIHIYNQKFIESSISMYTIKNSSKIQYPCIESKIHRKFNVHVYTGVQIEYYYDYIGKPLNCVVSFVLQKLLYDTIPNPIPYH